VFGVGGVTDAYLVAFLIPNFFRRLAGEGALGASFIPIFAEKDKTNRDDAERFASRAISYVCVVLTIVCVFAAVGSSVLVSVFAPGLRQTPAVFDLASRLLAVLFPYLLLMSLYAVISGMLNSRGHFGIPAVASALENISVITAALVLAPRIEGGPEARIWGLAAGVLVGGVLQVGLVWWTLSRTGFRFRPSLRRSPELVEMLLLMVPAAATLVVYQLNNIISQGIASFLPRGTITVLYLAYRVIEFPSALFGTAVGTVTLPKAAQAGNAEEFRAILDRSVRLCLLWMVPSMTAFIFFSEPLIRLMFEYGKFTADSVSGVSAALRAYALALPFIGLSRILSSACYAVKSPGVPMRAGAQAVAANVILSILFVWAFPSPYKACGIALGMSLASMVNLALLIRQTARSGILRGFQLNAFPTPGVLFLACSLVFAIPLYFLTPHVLRLAPGALKLSTAVLVFVSIGVYFLCVRRLGAGQKK